MRLSEYLDRGASFGPQMPCLIGEVRAGFWAGRDRQV